MYPCTKKVAYLFASIIIFHSCVSHQIADANHLIRLHKHSSQSTPIFSHFTIAQSFLKNLLFPHYTLHKQEPPFNRLVPLGISFTPLKILKDFSRHVPLLPLKNVFAFSHPDLCPHFNNFSYGMTADLRAP